MFTQIEKDIFNLVLEQVENELSNNVCNDFPVKVTDANREVLRALIMDMDEDDEDDEDDKEHLLSQLNKKQVYFMDWQLVAYVRKKITA